ncbi:hypothetical protein L6R50_06215 [Myxococcota bacterium]|nr:hypothetical protein [Myxococcota bacterium]
MTADEETAPAPAPAAPRARPDFALPVWAWAAAPPVVWLSAAGLLSLGGSPHPWWDARVAVRPLCTAAAALLSTNMVATPLISLQSPPHPVPEDPAERRRQWAAVGAGTALRLFAFAGAAALVDRVAATGVPEDPEDTTTRDVALASAMVASVTFGAAVSLLLRFAGPLGGRGVAVALACLGAALVGPHVLWGLHFNLTLLGQVSALWGPPAAASGVAASLAWAVWARRPPGPARAGSPALLLALGATAASALLGALVSGAWAISQPRAAWSPPVEVALDPDSGTRALVALSTRDGAPHAWLEGGGREVDLGRQALSVGISPGSRWVAVARRLPEVELLPSPEGWLDRFFDDRVEICAGPAAGPTEVCSPPLRVRTRAVGSVPIVFHPTLPRVLAAGADRLWVADLQGGESWTHAAAEPLSTPCWAADNALVLGRGLGGRGRVLRLHPIRVDDEGTPPPCLPGTPLPDGPPPGTALPVARD